MQEILRNKLFCKLVVTGYDLEEKEGWNYIDSRIIILPSLRITKENPLHPPRANRRQAPNIFPRFRKGIPF